MFTEKHAKELNALFEKQELSKSENERKKYLLKLWEEEQDIREYQAWVCSQNI